MTLVTETKRRPRVLTVLIVLFVVVGSGGAVVWHEFFATYHLATVQEGVLYRDGSRSPREFERTLRKVRPKLVVSLVDQNEASDPNKPQFVRENDIAAA